MEDGGEKMKSINTKIEGKTILITGASSGIGQAAALALASTDNCLILVSMKNKEGLENTAKKAII